MQIMITHGSLSRTRVLQFNRLQLAAALFALAILLALLSGAVYHFIFLKAAREGWPLVSQVVKLVVRDENAQRDQDQQSRAKIHMDHRRPARYRLAFHHAVECFLHPVTDQVIYPNQ